MERTPELAAAEYLMMKAALTMLACSFDPVATSEQRLKAEAVCLETLLMIRSNEAEFGPPFMADIPATAG